MKLLQLCNNQVYSVIKSQKTLSCNSTNKYVNFAHVKIGTYNLPFNLTRTSFKARGKEWEEQTCFWKYLCLSNGKLKSHKFKFFPSPSFFLSYTKKVFLPAWNETNWSDFSDYKVKVSNWTPRTGDCCGLLFFGGFGGNVRTWFYRRPSCYSLDFWRMNVILVELLGFFATYIEVCLFNDTTRY